VQCLTQLISSSNWARSALVSATQIVMLLLGALLCVFADSEVRAQPGNIKSIGVPSIPDSLSREVLPYLNIYGLPLAGWNPDKREIWLKGISSSTWVVSVSNPGAAPQSSSIHIKSSGIYDIYFQPQAKYLAYTQDTDGDESFQLHVYEISTGKSWQLAGGRSRNTEPVWSNRGDRIVYSSSPVGTAGVNLRVTNALDAKTDRLLAQSSGTYFKAYDWSPDDEEVVFCDFKSNTVSTLWLVKVADGSKELLSPKSDQAALYDYPQFSKDGSGVYVVTDHDSDVRRLAYIDLTSRALSYLQSDPKWDVDEFQVAPNGKVLAYVVNEGGISKLHVLNLVTKEEVPVDTLQPGIVSDLKWNQNSTDLAFNFKSPQAPNDVLSVNIATGKTELWGQSVKSGMDTAKFSRPVLIRWSSFDKRTISGFLYRPPSSFKGKRPVIIDIHGGPEQQYRPGFGYEHNYFIDQLGIAKIYPNVRGSTGFGRAFANLDNGTRREDAVKDIKALLEWIKTQPDLDSDRVLVQGISYGGYLALSTAANYGNQIRGVISESGISNLATFVEHTEGWRRELQRAEFGDEREPKTRAFMERTAPLSHARTLKTPLLIIQGQNDPRVPVAEAEKLVTNTKDRIPVWFILARNEGHGFVQQDNRDYRLFASILFVKQFLLK